MQRDMNKTTIELLDELRQLRKRNIELETLLANSNESEIHLREVSETALDAVIISDQDGNIVYWNKTATEIFGYEAEEALGSPITMLISEEAMKEYDEGKEHALTTGDSLFGKKTKVSIAKRKDGTKFPAEFTVSHWKTGDKFYFGGSLRDISEQKQAEKLLVDSEKKFRDIFEFATDGIIVADSQTRKFYDGNKAICQMLNYSREELKNLSAENIHPAEYRDSVVEHFTEMVKVDSAYPLELPTLKKDGSIFYTEVIARPMVLDGKQCLMGFFRDVTERKQQETALKESEARFRNIAESSPDAIFISDCRGQILYANKAVEQIYGYTEEELLGTAVEALEAESVREKYKNIRRNYKEDQSTFLGKMGEGMALHKNGTEFPVEVSTSSWTIDDRLHFSGIARDVTQRKQQEAALKASESRFRSIAESSMDAIITADSSGKILYWNKAAESLYGYTPQEMVGQSVELLRPEQNRSVEREIRETFIKTGQSDHLWKRIETIGRKKDGTEFFAETSFSYWEEEGKIFLCGSIRDITERKKQEVELRENEERFKAIAESSPDAIITADSKGKIIYCNKATEHIFGYSREELTGMSTEILRPKKKQQVDRKNRQLFLQKAQAEYIGKTVEGIGARKGGSDFPAEVSASYWKIDDEIFFSGIVRDITERKQMEEQLRRSQQELEKKVRQRTDELRKANEDLKISQQYLKKFAGMLLSVREEERKNISTTLHDELGSMALSVTSKISIAEEEIQDNNHEAALKSLREGQTAVRKAVDNLRRVAVDLRPPDLETFGLSAAITTLVHRFKEQSKLHIIMRNELDKKKLSEDTSIVIYRVIQEALTNVIKHAKAKNARINLSADKKSITLEIADDGVGCNMEKVLHGKGNMKIGIEGMRERVESLRGEFLMTSAPRKGIHIKAILPKK